MQTYNVSQDRKVVSQITPTRQSKHIQDHANLFRSLKSERLNEVAW